MSVLPCVYVNAPVDELYDKDPLAEILALARAVVKYWLVDPSATVSVSPCV